jgi:hypothetical protein
MMALTTLILGSDTTALDPAAYGDRGSAGGDQDL